MLKRIVICIFFVVLAGGRVKSFSVYGSEIFDQQNISKEAVNPQKFGNTFTINSNEDTIKKDYSVADKIGFMVRFKQQHNELQNSFSTANRSRHRRDLKSARGIVSKIIDILPFELHMPAYRYLGPGTKLENKLASNIPGINPLDEAAKEHDSAYYYFTDWENRHRADLQLEYKAWDRVNSKDATLGERAAALLTTNIIKIKRKLRLK